MKKRINEFKSEWFLITTNDDDDDKELRESR